MANGYGRSNEGFGITRQESVALIVKTAVENGVTDPRQIAYMLATAQHETRNFTAPDEDFGRQQARKLGYKGGEEYFGRGYVHLTHIENYQKFDRLLGLNGQLVKNPALAKDPELAAKILVIGMRDGLFTGKSLSRYIGDDSHDIYNARRVVNGVNPKQPWSVKAARDCVTYAKQWEKILTPERIAQLKATSATVATSVQADGMDVKEQQARLNQLGYTGLNGKPLLEDGVVGANTKHAIKTFQKEHGLTVDGIVGPKTLSALKMTDAKQQAEPNKEADTKAQSPIVDADTQKAGIQAQSVQSEQQSNSKLPQEKHTHETPFLVLDASLALQLPVALLKELESLAVKQADLPLAVNINIHAGNNNAFNQEEQRRNLTFYCAGQCAKENLPLDQVGSLTLGHSVDGKELIYMVSRDQQLLVSANVEKGIHTPVENSFALINPPQEQQVIEQQHLRLV